jgi:hypothetical protein
VRGQDRFELSKSAQNVNKSGKCSGRGFQANLSHESSAISIETAISLKTHVSEVGVPGRLVLFVQKPALGHLGDDPPRQNVGHRHRAAHLCTQRVEEPERRVLRGLKRRDHCLEIQGFRNGQDVCACPVYFLFGAKARKEGKA